jgi:hypothetical protein
VERAKERFTDDEQGSSGWERISTQIGDGLGPMALGEDSAEIETFPVMIRLNEIRHEVMFLHQQMSQFGAVLNRMERIVGDGLVMAGASGRAANVVPVGVTARANPMTHPVTPMSSSRSHDNGRDEALASVRALFASAQRRPWWQRLPLIGS